MLFFKKKKKEDEGQDKAEEDAESEQSDEPEVPIAAPPEKQNESSDVSFAKIAADVEKLKAQFTTFYELQKASAERFTRINEQIGEIRSMVIEREKAGQILEAKATQAIDIVKTVQPDKLMIELRKGDSKIEALRANLESTENIISNVVNELKDVKNHINTFRGMEQVISLNDEAKKELLETKKIQAVVERHADKVETIFAEMQKKFSDFAKLNDTVIELDKSFKQISSDFDSIKIKISDFASKKEVENLIAKFDDFEKYTGNIIKIINNKFEILQKELSGEFSKKFDEADKLLKGFETLALKTPDLDKYFNLLSEEAKKSDSKQESVKVEKIKELGAEEQIAQPAEDGIFSKFKGAASKLIGR